jgi:DNA-binding response OmpR family regulator
MTTATARPAVSPGRLAVLDSDTGFVHVLTNRLRSAGWQHQVLASPLAPRALLALRLTALVLDPGELGKVAWSYIKAVRDGLPRLGLVVCARPSTVAERVHGLRLGADDWVTKPCHPEEVIARVEAIVRRRVATPAAAPRRLAGGVELRPEQFQAFADDSSAELTRREFELLQLLADHDGQVLAREEIYRRVWGYEMIRGDRSVDVFVRKLRVKLERVSPEWRYIHTHFGVGYRLAPEPEPEPAGVADTSAHRPTVQTTR